MNLPTETFGDVIVVHTPDELGVDQADEFEAFVKSLDVRRVVLDLDGTESLDSTCLASLLDTQEALRDHGGDLKIATTNPVNRKIFEITRLDESLDIFDSVIDAAKSFH